MYKSSLVWLVLSCINYCWLFNAKSSLYIYIRYIWFGLVGFYDISTTVDYTGLQRNWGQHKNTRFYLIWVCWIQIWNPFLLITSSFLDMHSVHFLVIMH